MVAEWQLTHSAIIISTNLLSFPISAPHRITSSYVLLNSQDRILYIIYIIESLQNLGLTRSWKARPESVQQPRDSRIFLRTMLSTVAM